MASLYLEKELANIPIWVTLDRLILFSLFSMASGSLLTLLDDIAALLDDIATMTKVAAQKTAGVVGDDLALNAKQVVGLGAARELPVIWAVARGALLNKVFLVPLALGLSFFAPWALAPLLMLGGAFLCFEGVEKILESLHPQARAEARRLEIEALGNPDIDWMAFERSKIKSAVRTDLILSGEILAITLAVVQGHPFLFQLGVLALVAVLMTVFIYGLVALIVKIDDFGLWLRDRGGRLAPLGDRIARAAPSFMRGLSAVGTAAMLLVGGEFLLHGIAPLHHALVSLLAHQPLAWLWSSLAQLLFGALCGAALLGAERLAHRFWSAWRQGR